jgi:hypothetical protein
LTPPDIDETFYSRSGRPPRYEIRCGKCNTLLLSLIITEQGIVDFSAVCRNCGAIGAKGRNLRLEKYFFDQP